MTQAPVEQRRAAPAARAESPHVARLGEWELVEQVSHGQYARVYRARCASSSLTATDSYAVKVLSPTWQQDLRILEMFCQEARVGRLISHRHVLPVLAAELHTPPYYLVAPWLEGRTLKELIVEREQLPLPVILWIARQTAEGLDALHEAGWIHADVKPANIMVSVSGHATLIDLGFAMRSSECSFEGDRPLLGTTDYIAPEMFTSSMPIDIRSDIYSLGITLFEALTGRLPYHSDDVAELAYQHRHGLRGELRKHMPCVPTSVARLVRQMLAKDPLRRPQTPRELIERLIAAEIETFSER